MREPAPACVKWCAEVAALLASRADKLTEDGQAISPGQRAADASSTKTQSPSPELLFPGGVNFLLPVLANGEPSMSVYSPFVGSYQRAVAGEASFDMSTVIVRMVGR